MVVIYTVFLLPEGGNKNTLDFTTIPEAEEVADYLGLHLDVIYSALDHGVKESKIHFQDHGIGIDREKQAFSSLVRLNAKDYLKRRNLDSAELEHTNLCGIWLRIGPYHLKVWRISEEELEQAKVRASRLYEQFWFPQENAAMPQVHNLRIYWRLADKGLLNVYLGYPKYEDHKSYECFWLVDLKEPAASIPEANLESTGDLPIRSITGTRQTINASGA